MLKEGSVSRTCALPTSFVPRDAEPPAAGAAKQGMSPGAGCVLPTRYIRVDAESKQPLEQNPVDGAV